MGAAANAHDVERHVGFYAHDSSVIFIFNGQATIGCDAIRENQDRDLEERHIRRCLYDARKTKLSGASARFSCHHNFSKIAAYYAMLETPPGELRDTDVAEAGFAGPVGDLAGHVDVLDRKSVV